MAMPRYNISRRYPSMQKLLFLKRLFLGFLFLVIPTAGYVLYRENSIYKMNLVSDIHKHHLICIIDDSVTNSVFEGQIITPLLGYQQRDPELGVHIISFERNPVSQSKLDAIMPQNFGYNIFARYPLMGSMSLRPAIYRTQQVLNSLDSYSILARGPIASYIALNALDVTKCKKLTVQARSLFADEYDFCNVARSSGIAKLIHQWRLNQYYDVERKGYAPQEVPVPFELEAVTTALKDYLVKQYNADSNHITIAHYDIPDPISSEQRLIWRKEVREELNIPNDAYVYCYNGSVQLWQDAKNTVAMFVDEQKKHPGSYFIAITQNTDEFTKAFKELTVDESRCRLFAAKHSDVSRYLCACDTGLLYRVDHVISWVARPVKVLEYQAAGLEVVHNNTVAWVKEVLA